MARRRPTAEPAATDAADVARERRERLRRDRERRRQHEPAAPAPSGRRAGVGAFARKDRSTSASPRPSAVAVRERREGLVSWLARSVTALPTRAKDIVRGFALEVVSVLGAIGLGIVRLVPGARHVMRARAASDDGPGRLGRLRSRVRAADAADARRPRTRVDAMRRARLRRRLQVVLAAGLLASMVTAAIVVPRSDAFRIRQLAVSGASAVSDLEVRERIDGLLAGKTVFTVDEDAIAARIEDLPFVQAVRVERHLPGGLELHVREYRPLALALGAGKYWLVARDGRVLTRADRAEWEGRVPLVTLRSSKVTPGMRVDDEPALLLLAARGSRSSLMFDVVEAEDFRLVGTLTSGVEVRFGRAVELRQKVLSAQRVLSAARRDGITPLYVDVSVPSKPAICSRTVTACGMARIGTDAGEDPDASAATTPEELGGDEAVVEAAAGVDVR